MIAYPAKSSGGISLIPAESQLLRNRKIFLTGPDGIDADSACEFASLVMLLTAEDAERPIDLLINSPGGDINAGLLIYDIIQGSRTPIRTFCLGRAFSMAAVLFACGNHGRFILPHSEVMLHEPLLGNRIGGNASSVQSISEALLETKRKINGLLAKHTGKTAGEIEEASRYDHYFSAEEAVDFGLADKIESFDFMTEV